MLLTKIDHFFKKENMDQPVLPDSNLFKMV